MFDIIAEAQSFEQDLVRWRRHIHGFAELGMDVPKTSAFVAKELEAMGYAPQFVAGTGVVAMVGPEKGKGVLLLRADMDALPIREDNDLDFKATNGNCHACGHDLHTAMLLGAARILKRHEKELTCRVKLMFQPAEEIIYGAKQMIDAGVLENPKVDAALMIHTFTGYPCPTGVLLVNDTDYVMPSCDMFEIEIQGTGGHGSTP
jgi:hippurate hydrolase